MIPRVFTFSEPGGHPVNEDSFGVRSHPDEEGCLVGALADGQGGRAGAAHAAQVACLATLEAAAGFPARSVQTPSYWPTILRLADQAVSHEDQAGFTTLVGFAVSPNAVYGASCGDSALLAYDATDRFQEVTHLQSKNPPVGSGAAFFCPFSARLTPPWLLVAMSDGVWKFVGWERLKEKATRLRGQALIDSLCDAARLRGSQQFQDDFTLIVIQDGN